MNRFIIIILLFLVLLGNVYATNYTANQISYYPFNTTWIDYWSGKNMTSAGTASNVTNGYLQWQSQYAYVATIASLYTNKNLTFFVQSLAGSKKNFTFADTQGNIQFQIGSSDTGVIDVFNYYARTSIELNSRIYTAACGWRGISWNPVGGGAVINGTDYNMTSIYNGTGWKMYINGILINQTDFSTPCYVGSLGKDQLQIGRHYWNNGVSSRTTSAGAFGTVKAWNTMLDGTSITNLQTCGDTDCPTAYLTYSNWNVTSDGGCTIWNTNNQTHCNVTDSTPTVTFTTSQSSACRIGVTDSNYTALGTDRNCSGTTAQTCTLNEADALTAGASSDLYFACDYSEGVASDTGSMKINYTYADYLECTGDNQCYNQNCDAAFSSTTKYCHPNASNCVNGSGDGEINNTFQQCTASYLYQSCNSGNWTSNITVDLGKVCKSGADANIAPNGDSLCGVDDVSACYSAIGYECVNRQCYANRYYEGYNWVSPTTYGWVDTGYNWNVPNGYYSASTSNNSLSECVYNQKTPIPSYDDCSNQYTRSGPDGFCDGSGSPNPGGASLAVQSGYVCHNGLNETPSSDTDCGAADAEACSCATWYECVISACTKPEYYTGFNANASCTVTNWQAQGTSANVAQNMTITNTENASSCIENSSYSCGLYFYRTQITKPTTSNLAVSTNQTNGFNSNIIWTNPLNYGNLYLYYHNTSLFAIGNNTANVPYEIESTGLGLNPTSVYDNDAIAVYHLGINSTTQIDSTKYGNNGTVTDATWVSNGKFGGAYSFDGDNDYIVMTNFTLNNWDNKTVCLWIYPKEVNTEQQSLIAFDTYNGLFQITGGVVRLELQGSGGMRYNTASVLSNNTWIHICYSHGWLNSSIARVNTDAKIYLNGVNVSIGTSAIGSATTTQTTLNLGTYNIGSYTFDYNGTIDEVRIWNRTLSATEISELYNNSVNSRNMLLPETCTYSTGNWFINASEYCRIEDNANLISNNLTISGSGIVSLYANITNFTKIDMYGINNTNRCIVDCKNSNCFKK